MAFRQIAYSGFGIPVESPSSPISPHLGRFSAAHDGEERASQSIDVTGRPDLVEAPLDLLGAHVRDRPGRRGGRATFMANPQSIVNVSPYGPRRMFDGLISR